MQAHFVFYKKRTMYPGHMDFQGNMLFDKPTRFSSTLLFTDPKLVASIAPRTIREIT